MNYEHINQISQEAGIPIDVSEYHGKISACLCIENLEAEALLPEEINADIRPLSSGTMKLKNVLLCLIEETLQSLNDTEMTFYPLLSPDSESLINRTLSLSSWCQGFIDGLTLAVTQKNISMNIAEQEIIMEIIEDFSQISKLTSASVMNEGGEELAYMEVVEYVRVGTQLMFEESKAVKS